MSVVNPQLVEEVLARYAGRDARIELAARNAGLSVAALKDGAPLAAPSPVSAATRLPQQDDPRGIALAARLRRLPPELATDPRAESPLGVLYLTSRIDRGQHAAGLAYAAAARDHAAIIGAPSRHARSIDMSSAGGRALAEEMPAARIVEIRERWRRCISALIRLDETTAARDALDLVVLDERDPPDTAGVWWWGTFVAALDAIAREFGLTDRTRIHQERRAPAQYGDPDREERLAKASRGRFGRLASADDVGEALVALMEAGVIREADAEMVMLWRRLMQAHRMALGTDPRLMGMRRDEGVSAALGLVRRGTKRRAEQDAKIARVVHAARQAMGEAGARAGRVLAALAFRAELPSRGADCELLIRAISGARNATRAVFGVRLFSKINSLAAVDRGENPDA